MMVPGASANSVGLTAATTNPVAATSRTNDPRVTTAERRRSREITFSDESQARALHTKRNSSTKAAAAM